MESFMTMVLVFAACALVAALVEVRSLGGRVERLRAANEKVLDYWQSNAKAARELARARELAAMVGLAEDWVNSSDAGIELKWLLGSAAKPEGDGEGIAP